MRAAVIWTISDFSRLWMLRGIQTKWYKACPICLDDIDAVYNNRRMLYQGARRWLPLDHHYRTRSAAFNVKHEFRIAPPLDKFTQRPLSIYTLFNQRIRITTSNRHLKRDCVGLTSVYSGSCLIGLHLV